jgi:uncharacterized protein
LPRLLTRRRFFTAAGAGIAGLGAYAFGVEPHLVTVTRRDLPIDYLPTDLEGKRLVQLSDLHLGPVKADYLTDCFARVAKLRPELVVLTGDYMTCRDDEQVPPVAALLDRLVRPPLGVFAILGNHDYGPSFAQKSLGDEVARAISRVGIRVLRNESVDVCGLQVIGLDEMWADQFQPSRAFAGYDVGRAALVLSHNPDSLDVPGWADYRGWVLSGHTHGGQCKPPFLNPPILPVKNPLYTSGAIDLGDGRRVYINRGLGYNHRVRFNARPEITAFTLRRA